MAIVNNTAGEIGDVLRFDADAPIVGILSLDSYTDVTINETGTRLFDKEFSYSFNGVTFSDWIELTNPNLQAVPVQATDFFHIQYRYTRIGVDPTDILTWQEITLNTTSQASDCPIFDASVFKKFFDCDDTEALGWAVNVYQKLHEQGIVPKYITRAEENTLRSDADYQAYWMSVTTFFAYLVKLARVLENFHTDIDLLQEYLRQFDQLTCGNEALDELGTLLLTQIQSIARRGSTDIYRQATAAGEPNGELLRLLCWKDSDEFVIGVNQARHIGWCIGNNSPMYRSKTDNLHLTKAYEFTPDVLDLTPYPLLTANGTVQLATESTLDVMEITNVTIAEVAGIGDVTDQDKMIVVEATSPTNYEITFLVKGGEPISFGCYGFDISFNPVSMQNAQDGSSTDLFFTEESLGRSDKYYLVRGIIFNSGAALQPGVKTNLDVGNNLRMPSTINYIIPYIVLDNTSGGGASGSVYLYDIKVNPASLPYSNGYLNNGKLVEVICENNNGNYTDEEVTAIMRKKLIPYNTSFKNTFV